jgi:hypothetical protein
MNISKEQQALESAIENYSRQLGAIPDELFSVTPPQGGWSYAEVYDHTFQMAILSAVAMERCANLKGELNSNGPGILGRIIFLLGFYPPVKLKVPAKVAVKNPVKKISKEEAEALIVKLSKRLNYTIPLINGGNAHSRIKHPRLGMLNAFEWLKFIRIHTEHHLKQLARIEKNLN